MILLEYYVQTTRQMLPHSKQICMFGQRAAIGQTDQKRDICELFRRQQYWHRDILQGTTKNLFFPTGFVYAGSEFLSYCNHQLIMFEVGKSFLYYTKIMWQLIFYDLKSIVFTQTGTGSWAYTPRISLPHQVTIPPGKKVIQIAL